MIRLLVGLGNPGPEYEDTRHNAGFAWVEAAARTLGGQWLAERSYFGLVARVNRIDGPIWLLKPQTFMNLSGKAVAPLARFFKIAPEEILVVHDELDLLPGQVRLKKGGAPGGNGVRDVAAQLGSPEFWRLRLGIGHPGVKTEVANYVLRRAPAAEREATQKALDDSLAALDLLLAGDMERAMMKIHAKPPRPKPPRKDPAAAPAPEVPPTPSEPPCP